MNQAAVASNQEAGETATAAWQRQPLLSIYYAFCSLQAYLAFERAAEMYITVDEAITYADHIRPRLSGLFDFSAANNHFLNSLLAKALSTLAPYNELAIRLPSLAIGAWFFFYYLPRRIQQPLRLLLLTCLCLLPYYISEYWSMSRGYFMSTCFAAAAVLELMQATGEHHPSRSTTEAQALLWAQLYGSLSVLASFVMLPFSLCISAACLGIHRPTQQSPLAWLPRNPGLWVTILTAGFSYRAIRTFQASGEALAKGNSMSFTTPIDAVAAGGLVGWPWLATAYLGLLILALAWCGWKRQSHQLIAIATVLGSIALLWLGGTITGGFPIERSWIPYWFPLCVLISLPLSTPIELRPRTQTAFGLLAAGLAMANTSHWYTPDYSYYWRSNYYQAKALFYYESKGVDYCLEDVFKYDWVLRFYWDDPKSAVKQPRDCRPGEHSPLGFTNFEVPGKTFKFPEKIWGKHADGRVMPDETK